MNCHKHNLVPSELDRLSAINYCSSRTKLPTLPSLKTLKRTKPKKSFKERSGLQKSFVRFRFRWGRRTMGFRRRQSSESNSGTENSGWQRSYLVQKSGKCRVESKIFRRVTESVRFRSFISRFFSIKFFFRVGRGLERFELPGREPELVRLSCSTTRVWSTQRLHVRLGSRL